MTCYDMDPDPYPSTSQGGNRTSSSAGNMLSAFASGHSRQLVAGSFQEHFAGPTTILHNHVPAAPVDSKLACLRSLSFQSIDFRRNNIELACEGTCDWLFSKTEFCQWLQRGGLEDNNGVLWIKGKPGAGKSTLMKHALVHCQRTLPDDALIAAYFFNARGGGHLDKSPLGMLRSLLYQLLDQSPHHLALFIPLFLDKQRKHGNSWDWEWGELSEFMFKTLRDPQQHPRPIVLFVDALDECVDDDAHKVVSFLETLSAAAVRSSTSLNICLSSRFYPHITMSRKMELVVDQQHEHDEDIAVYVRRNLRVGDEEVVQGLLTKAQGVFMWVILATSLINKKLDQGRVHEIRQTLDDLPPELDELFQEILAKDNDHIEETVLLLQWVLFAREQLRPRELYLAVLAGTAPDGMKRLDQSAVTDECVNNFITHTSRGLVEMREEDYVSLTNTLTVMVVQFIHETVNDFLLRNNRLRTLDSTLDPHVIGKSHDRLAGCCLAYVERMEHASTATEVGHVGFYLTHYPFLLYVSMHLLYHAQQAQQGSVPQNELLRRLHDDRELFAKLATVHDVFAYDGKQKYSDNPNLLHVLSFERPHLVETLFNIGVQIDVNAQGGRYGNALQAAAAAVSDRNPMTKSVIRMLLQEGADVNAQGGYFGNALQAAAARTNFDDFAVGKEVIQMLREAGADVNAQGGHFGNALQAAVATPDLFRPPSKEIVCLLLKARADVRAKGGYYGNALQAAAASAVSGLNEKFTIEIIQLLIKAGADINQQGGHYGNALQAAAAGKKNINDHPPTRVIKLLLDAGADVNLRGGEYGSALQAVAARAAGHQDHIEVVRMFLKFGARVNSRGGKHGSALGAALLAREYGIRFPIKVIEILLNTGADLDAIDLAGALQEIVKDGISYIQEADNDMYDGGALEVLSLLQAHGAEGVDEARTKLYNGYGWDATRIEQYERYGWDLPEDSGEGTRNDKAVCIEQYEPYGLDSPQDFGESTRNDEVSWRRRAFSGISRLTRKILC